MYIRIQHEVYSTEVKWLFVKHALIIFKLSFSVVVKSFCKYGDGGERAQIIVLRTPTGAWLVCDGAKIFLE